MLNRSSLSFPAELERLPDMIRFIDAWCEEIHLRKDRSHSLRLIVDELVSNICRQSLLQPNVSIVLTLFRSEDTVTLEIQDSGVPFNPSEHKEPDTSLPLEKRPIGGLGLLLVRRLSKAWGYRRENGQNLQTVVLDNRDNL